MMLNCAKYFYSKNNLKLGETTSQNLILIPGSAALAFHVKLSFSSWFASRKGGHQDTTNKMCVNVPRFFGLCYGC